MSHPVDQRMDMYKESSKGDDWVFCPMCTYHMKREEVRENNGYCMGCEHMTEVEQKLGLRGGL